MDMASNFCTSTFTFTYAMHVCMYVCMCLLAVVSAAGNAEIYCPSGLVIRHEQGMRYDPSFMVPVSKSACDSASCSCSVQL